MPHHFHRAPPVVRAVLGGPPVPVLVLLLALAGSVVLVGIRPAAPSNATTTLHTPTVAPVVAAASASASATTTGTASAEELRRDARWVWPTGSRVVGRPWEAPADDYAAGHRGLDVPAALGTAAVAVADGTVAFAGQVAGRPVVTIDHGEGLVSTLDSVAPVVRAGDAVEQGAVVGHVTVGHCPATDPCVHLGARVDDRYVDPTPYLPPAAWPVLLPDDAWDP